jgi:putative flippase GtrA
LLSGHSDVAIGTRLANGSNVVRGAKRALISRAYNTILHTVLRARFSDAQCGFKAVRAETARELIGEIRDDGWFFDTELLVLAQRRGLRIYEVPVDWVDDPDSRVDIVRTARADLHGVARLWAASPVVRFMGIGVLSTVAYALLLVLLRAPLGAQAANASALALTAVANTQANRRLTFGIAGRPQLLRHHVMAFVVFLLTLAITTESLVVLQTLDHSPARLLETAVLVAASAAATVTRYVGLKAWVFANSGDRPCPQEPPRVRSQPAQGGS